MLPGSDLYSLPAWSDTPQPLHGIICYQSLVSGITMAQTQLATRIDDRVKKAVEEVCNVRGLKMNRFIEDALIDKLEELEDIEDLVKIRREPSRPLADILRDLNLEKS
jgi:hypothetical protein